MPCGGGQEVQAAKADLSQVGLKCGQERSEQSFLIISPPTPTNGKMYFEGGNDEPGARGKAGQGQVSAKVSCRETGGAWGAARRVEVSCV